MNSLSKTCAIIFSILLGVLGVTYATPVQAQFESMLDTAGTVTLSTTPEFPEAGQRVTVRLSSFAVDLDARMIIWKANGEIIAQEMGKTTHVFTMGTAGERLIVETEIIMPTEIIRKRQILTPGGLDILWEAPDSYVPPFYRGKALPSRESKIRATAIPRGVSFASPEAVRDFIFTWEQNFTVRGSLSGYGRDSFEFINRLTENQETVGVTMRNAGGTLSAQKRTDIVFVEPEVLFYRESSTLGVRPQALQGSLTVDTQTLTLIAEPFSFSAPGRDVSHLSFDWRVGNRPLRGVGGMSLGRIATIEPSARGRVLLSTTVDNERVFLQAGSGSIQVTFR
ncbi:MAG: hypothetical protein LRY41_01730 [Candidatus Pacebacteria bacterium]|nr:hypothetical protein [Candidatus Paceibacterota bacterium]MCD8507821.1 hypothetical protein [Candidatus Paceibacterota bacterium]MCD8528031.1 hypothetical protein [Candidatus Paceibacterota bacterium]MCD8563887.1 hypothetical protein [Candidatus Paceibacterota bacterium]